MGWVVYGRSDRDDLVGFLSKDEWGHVGFSSSFKEMKGSVPQGTIYIRRDSREDGRIVEAVLCTQAGLLIPVLSTDKPSGRLDLKQALFRTKRKRSLNTIMGLSRNVESLQAIVESACRASVNYHIMTLTEPPRR
ncbi:MAG: hypothetical protein JW852_11725, partial [Spirochaetales bacterium]|nr:hypothetical protein [Spirochaetales bacterium]